ncbi:hypothetical protein Pelo_18890 [Pelomyxa schiedti]|nr:hypothetical protein Pelo_18890 [Pelomyxa schiedti]
MMSVDKVAAVAAVTTRSQLGALAAGATISRCGANSAMVGAMGHGHATSLVRMLWSDWVRPTIRFFVVDARGFPSEATVSFALSPLLLSVALAPACFDVGFGSSWVDSNRFAYVRFGGDPYLPGAHIATDIVSRRGMKEILSYTRFLSLMVDKVTSVAAVTTRSQLGALAAGAAISRCGANSAMVGVMGHGHATSLVRMLWSDWVRPTILFFVVDARGFPSGATTCSYSQAKSTTTVSFALSPLLLSVALAPAPPPACINTASGASWVDSDRAADVAYGGSYPLYHPVVWVRDVHTRLPGGAGGVAVARGRPGEAYVYAVDSKWAAMVSYSTAGNGSPAALTVASLLRVPSVDDHTGMEYLSNSVVVEMPFVDRQ